MHRLPCNKADLVRLATARPSLSVTAVQVVQLAIQTKGR